MYGMKQPVVPKGGVLRTIWAVLASTPAFFLSHFTRTQESLAKSTFARQLCQRGNECKSLGIKENSAVGFSLQRLGEVHRKTASRRDSCRTAIVTENASNSARARPEDDLRRANQAVFLQVFQQLNGCVLW